MPSLRFAVRQLAKSPFVTSVAVMSIAFGIGANTAIFSLFDQMLLRPLPVPEPERLVSLSSPGPKRGSVSCNDAGPCDAVFSYPMFRDLEAVQEVFTGIAAHRSFDANLASKGMTESAVGVLVSGSYFQVLGVKPAAGRLLTPDDDRTIGGHFVAVLAYDYWRRRFDADPGVVNESITINGQAMTIVGVAPRGFIGANIASPPDVFVPITMRGLTTPGWKGFDDRLNYWVYLFARLKPGVSIEQARAALNVPYRSIVNDVESPLQKGMSDKTLEMFRAKELLLEDGRRGQSVIHREAREPLIILLGVTSLVLLIACANIVGLLLARASARASEMAVRLSIGGSRRHLVAQLLTESLILAVAGGVAGMLVARWTLSFISSLMPAEAFGFVSLRLEPSVLAFAAGSTLLTGLLFGLIPALHATRPDLASVLKGTAGQPSGAGSTAFFRKSLATFQVALAMALLVSAGLFTKSLVNVSRVDLGIRPDNLVTFGISPELNNYTPEQSRALFERLEDELSAVPGIASLSASLVPLIAGSSWGNSVSVEGFDAGPDTDTEARFNEIGPGYFRTLGIPLLAGREFTRSDALGAPRVAIVNEAFARKFNLGRDAVGKRMGRGRNRLDMEIVGLVRDAKYNSVKEPVPPLFFVPYRQDETIGTLCFYVRSEIGEEHALRAIQPVAKRLDPNLPIERLRPMRAQIRENVFMDRVIALLSTSFALLATLLSAVGLYGVLAYTVAQRTREIGLRMALGADGGRVRRMILKQVATMILVGGPIGLVSAYFAGSYAQSQLFELQGHDPVVFAVAAVMLSAVALCAGFIPASRASRIDPMLALRYE